MMDTNDLFRVVRFGRAWDADTINASTFMHGIHNTQLHRVVQKFMMNKQLKLSLDELRFVFHTAPKKLVQHLYETQQLPTLQQEESPHVILDLVVDILRNRTAVCLVKYLHEIGYIDFRPDASWIPLADRQDENEELAHFLRPMGEMNAETLRYLLSPAIGWKDFRNPASSILDLHLQCPFTRGKADLIQVLLEHECIRRPPFLNWWWPIDLRTFKLLEPLYSQRELTKWIIRSASAIALLGHSNQDIALLKYQMQTYHLTFGEESFSTCLAFDLHESQQSWLHACTTRCFLAEQRDFYFELAVVLSLYHTPIPGLCPLTLQVYVFDFYILKHRWEPRLLSPELKYRIKTLLLCVRRYMGTTRWIKPLLYQIVAGSVSKPRGHIAFAAPTSDWICNLQ